ncbi:twin-arginine translocation signal domain-containing protein [Pseudaestuariivita atlantica]|uniref:twin-arginine translocation signal domain-containing protein n=1 Tax=Pseudaestuariivita atlantica TaxID=1317121 RepID=UPI000D7CD3B8|nr:twin-arginine translocation signal domain-containing protein [Pseudaestuariivita atlantica]
MNRRDFLASSGAAAGLAAVPVPVKAATLTKTAQPARYVWAVAMAQARGHVSAEVIAQSLKLPMNEAAALVTKLQTRGIVGAASANGVARATAPLFRAGVTTSTAQTVTAKVRKSVSDTAEKVIRRVADDLISDDDPAPPEASDEARSAE